MANIEENRDESIEYAARVMYVAQQEAAGYTRSNMTPWGALPDISRREFRGVARKTVRAYLTAMLSQDPFR